MKFETTNVLKKLGINEINPGAYCSDAGWSPIADRPTFTTMDPANGQTVCQIAGANAQDYDRIMTCAIEAQKRWRMVPAPERGKFVARLGALIRENLDDLAAIASIDTGKSTMESRGELIESIDMSTLAAGQARMLYGFTQQSQRPRHRMYDQWMPLGVVAVITAYNFPAAVWAQNGFLSAICGNTVIWKPSPKVPLTAIALQKLANQVMDETGHHGIFSLYLPESNETADLLVRDERVPLVSFTGSTAVGKYVKQVTSESLGRRSLLECSGNNGCIVDETADLKLAARSITFGVVGTTGQRCTSMRRLIAHKTVSAKLVEYLCSAFSQIPLGDPREEDAMVGPIIDDAAVDQFKERIQEVTKLGGKVVYGGEVLDRPGNYVMPTIVTGCDASWPCVQEETFVPILYVMEYEDFDDALALHNGVVQGLASGIHSNHLAHIERFLSAEGSDCGIAKVNMGTTGADVGGAFGGEKETGGGRTAGSDAWKGYMRRQSVCVNWSDTSPWDSLIALED